MRVCLSKYLTLWNSCWTQGSEHTTNISAALNLPTGRNAVPEPGPEPWLSALGCAWALCGSACSLVMLGREQGRAEPSTTPRPCPCPGLSSGPRWALGVTVARQDRSQGGCREGWVPLGGTCQRSHNEPTKPA